MALNPEKKTVFNCFVKNGIQKLDDFKHSGKEVEYLSLKVENITHFQEFIKTFPNVKKLEIATKDMEGEIPKEVKFKKLKSAIFLNPIKKNLWSIFSNLEEISFGTKGHIELFTSEFINGIIELNKNTLTKLDLIHVAVAKNSYEPLRIPCQLKELNLHFCFDSLLDEICRKEKDRMLEDSSQINKRFFIRKNQIVTFQNAKDVIESQKNLNHLTIERIVIDEDFLNSISQSGARSLKLIDTALRFDAIKDQAKEFFNRLKKVDLSRLPNKPGLRVILSHLQDVEILDIHFIFNCKMNPLEERNVLSKLRPSECITIIWLLKS
ncbi:hypothetical protein ACFFRR_010126 [Megaselia abdita]